MKGFEYSTMFRYVILLITISSLPSCDDKEHTDPPPVRGFADIDAVTGMDFFDENGAAIGRWMTPNDRTRGVAAFPNPALGSIFLIASPEELEFISNVWIVPADCLLTDATNIVEQSQNLSFSSATLDQASITSVPIDNPSSSIIINLSELSPGLYKVFYQGKDGDIGWTNIYCDPTVNSIPEFSFLDDLCTE